MIEFMVATGVMLVALVSMVFTTLAGFRGIAVARRRQVANALANQAVEQVRGLSFQTLSQGMGNTDLSTTTDSRIVKSGSPTVYSYNGEQVPHSDITAPKPLVPHQNTVVHGNITYTVSAYLTYYQNVVGSTTYRLTIIVSWPSLQGPSGQVQVQTVVYSPSCASSATHPFSAPCQPFLYGSAQNSPGQISIGGTIQNLALDHAALFLPGQSSGMQLEQVQAVQGTAQTSGVTIQQVGQAEQALGRQQVSSGADNDPGQPKPGYTTATGGAQSADSRTLSGSSNDSITVNASGGDTASSVSTVQASSTLDPNGNFGPCPPVGVSQNDAAPCGNSSSQQGGTMSATVDLRAGPNDLGQTVLASVGAQGSPGTAFTNRDTVPDTVDTTVCTQTSGDGCLQSKQTRSRGTVTIGALPPAVVSPAVADLPPNWNNSKGLLQLTNFADSVKAEAGVGSSAPAASITGGSISYWNGTSYSTLNLVGSSTATAIATAAVHLSDVISNGSTLTIDITAQLSTGGTVVTDTPPAGCSTICTRTTASAQSNSPITGQVTYVVTYGGQTLSNLTYTIDLGTLLAKSTYQAAPGA